MLKRVFTSQSRAAVLCPLSENVCMCVATKLSEAAYLSNAMDMHMSMTHHSDREVGGEKNVL